MKLMKNHILAHTYLLTLIFINLNVKIKYMSIPYKSLLMSIPYKSLLLTWMG